MHFTHVFLHRVCLLGGGGGGGRCAPLQGSALALASLLMPAPGTPGVCVWCHACAGARHQSLQLARLREAPRVARAQAGPLDRPLPAAAWARCFPRNPAGRACSPPPPPRSPRSEQHRGCVVCACWWALLCCACWLLAVGACWLLLVAAGVCGLPVGCCCSLLGVVGCVSNAN